MYKINIEKKRAKSRRTRTYTNDNNYYDNPVVTARTTSGRK